MTREVSNAVKINDSRRILDLRRHGWELEKTATVTQRRSVLVNCDPESSSRIARSGLNWNQKHGIYAEHKGRKDWDTYENLSAISQTIP